MDTGRQMLNMSPESGFHYNEFSRSKKDLSPEHFESRLLFSELQVGEVLADKCCTAFTLLISGLSFYPSSLSVLWNLITPCPSPTESHDKPTSAQSSVLLHLISLHSLQGGFLHGAGWGQVFLLKNLWTNWASSSCPLPSSLCPSSLGWV